MKVLILAGGSGTRLGALTKAHQKCMLDVGGKPFLTYLVSKLTKKYTLHYALGFKAEEVIKHFSLGKVEHYINTESQLSAINEYAAKCQSLDFMAINGDTFLFDYDYTNGYSVVVPDHDQGVIAAGIYYVMSGRQYNTMSELLCIENFLHVHHGPWVDIGSPEGLQYARSHVEDLK